MSSVKECVDRRQFILPISFPDRRKGERRKQDIPTIEERRELLKQGKLAILESLGLDLLNTDPRESIKVVLGEIAGINPLSINEGIEIRELGFDSFKMVEMMAAIETIYDITLLDDGAILKAVTVDDLINLIYDQQSSSKIR